MKKTLIAASLSLMLAGCATNGATAAGPEDAAAAIAAAEAARGQAAAVGYEWRDTASLIDEARKAVEAKDYSKAVSLASSAERQSVYAVKQQADQAGAAAVN